jgi:muconate cycloisomerase
VPEPSPGRLRGPDHTGSSLVIKSIETTLLDIPLIRPHKFSVLTIDTQTTMLVRVLTEDGIVGIGEGVVPGGPWWGGESIEGMRIMVIQYLAPLLVGEDALRVDYLAHRMDRLVTGARFAKAAVEMALWDACGKALGVPLYQLLGGAHRTSLPVTWALGAEPAPAVVDEAIQKLESGAHQRFKLKMGALAPAADVARVAEIAEALAPKAELAVDLNGSWAEQTARRWLPALDAAGITVVEQPLPAWNIEGAARIRSSQGCALMADESVLTAHDAQALVTASAADMLALKLAKSGGITAIRQIAAIAEAAGVSCYGGTTIETSVGTAAAAHAFCSCAPLTAGTELFGPLLLADDIAENPARYHEGKLLLGGGPGLGVILDEDKVAKYART